MPLSVLSHLRTSFFVCGAETWECVIMAAVVQQNELVFEFASNVMEDEQQVWDSVRNHIHTSWC